MGCVVLLIKSNFFFFIKSLFSTGRVADLTNQTATAVAIGKAHIVVLNSEGEVFTFGINNKVDNL